MAAGQTDETDRQMKQTQGPQRFAFCANQINTFNKAYIGTKKLQIQLYEKISQFTQFFNVQMLQKQTNKKKKRFAIQAIKNTIEKLFLKNKTKTKGNFAGKPAAREVGMVELKHSLKNQLP